MAGEKHSLVMDEEAPLRPPPAIREMLHCPVCLDVFVRPITFDCGHSCCELCTLKLQSWNCPTCRKPPSHSTNTFSWSIARTLSTVCEAYLSASRIEDRSNETREFYQSHVRICRCESHSLFPHSRLRYQDIPPHVDAWSKGPLKHIPMYHNVMNQPDIFAPIRAQGPRFSVGHAYRVSGLQENTPTLFVPRERLHKLDYSINMNPPPFFAAEAAVVLETTKRFIKNLIQQRDHHDLRHISFDSPAMAILVGAYLCCDRHHELERILLRYLSGYDPVDIFRDLHAVIDHMFRSTIVMECSDDSSDEFME